MPFNDKVFRRMCINKLSVAQLKSFLSEKDSKYSEAKIAELQSAARIHFNKDPEGVLDLILEGFDQSYHQTLYLGFSTDSFDTMRKQLSATGLSDFHVFKNNISRPRGWSAAFGCMDVKVQLLLESFKDDPVKRFVIRVPFVIESKGETVVLRVMTIKNVDWLSITGVPIRRALKGVNQDQVAGRLLDIFRASIGFSVSREFDFSSKAAEYISKKEIDTFDVRIHDPGEQGGGCASYSPIATTPGARRKRLPLREALSHRLKQAVEADVVYMTGSKSTEDLLGLPKNTSLTMYPNSGYISIGSMLKGGSLHEFLDFICE